MFGAEGDEPGAEDGADSDAHRLPAVLHTAPAAVLMIDPPRRLVVYANPAAIELTGERVRLPVDIDTWSDAAGLTDLGGRRMSETDSPLSLVAAGVPVAGEPVAVHDAARRGSSATADQREASEGRLLWVTGFVLSDGTALDIEERALVAFLQLTGNEKGERSRLEVLRDRAVVATEMSFTITDPRRVDDPLIWVNPAFTRLTGYSPAEVIGRNCRLLQGPATDRAAVDRIVTALRERAPITEVLLNYRRDGTAFWNQVSISPVFDGAGELVNFVGVQNDVTERVLVEQERRAALAEAEEARGHLRLLAEATTEMTAAPDVTTPAGAWPAWWCRSSPTCARWTCSTAPEGTSRGGSPSPRATRRTRRTCTVGDVVGHDLRAAAAMGQLRGVLRSYAWDGGGPGSVLDRCDRLVQGLEMAAMATAVYARIEPQAADGSRLIRYANAGHPARWCSRRTASSCASTSNARR